MEIDLQGIVIIVGNYGSGKTEVAVNLAMERKKAGVEVRIADLDLINPYFRTREAKQILADAGIEVVMPPPQYFHADLPILSPDVAGLIRNPGQLAILDAGGNDAGATVLAALADALKGTTPHMLQVVNPFRPFTETVDGCLKIKAEIEAAAKIKINGIVGNANMMDETELEQIYEGYEFVSEVAQAAGAELKFVTCPVGLLPSLDRGRVGCPVLALERRLTFPWKRPLAGNH